MGGGPRLGLEGVWVHRKQTGTAGGEPRWVKHRGGYPQPSQVAQNYPGHRAGWGREDEAREGEEGRQGGQSQPVRCPVTRLGFLLQGQHWRKEYWQALAG